MHTIKEEKQINAITLIGWLYGIASIISGVYLFANSKTVSVDYNYLGQLDTKVVTNPAIIGLAIGLLLSGILFAILCSAATHILKNQQALQEGQIEILNACKD